MNPVVFISLDKANRLDVGNAVNPRPSEEDNKLVIVKSPNAVNPLVLDYSVSILMDYDLPNSRSLLRLIIFVPMSFSSNGTSSSRGSSQSKALDTPVIKKKSVLPPFVASWRVRSWVQVPPSACNLPIKKRKKTSDNIC
jgi:hypothetical protein